MKKILKIYIRDLKTIAKNPAAIVIMIGLSILPSLYAWINIAACWDPYANTGNLPVAVINKDEGAVFNGKNINVGNEIIKQLKNNKNIGWQFVDEWQANYGLNEGKYYALIEIPNSFSKELTSLTSVSPTKPYITYRVNQKLNAIAAKITNAAKNQLADNVKSNFIATVNNEAFKTLNDIGGKLNVDKSKILQLRDTAAEANSNIDSIKKVISDANSNSENLQNYLSKFKTSLPKLTEQINSLQKSTEASKELVLSTKQTVNNTASNLSSDLIQMQSTIQQFQNVVDSLKSGSGSPDSNTITSSLNQLTSLNDSLTKIITNDINYLNSINSVKPNNNLKNLINSLTDLKKMSDSQTGNINETKKIYSANSSKDNIDSSLNSLSATGNQLTNQANTASNIFYTGVLPVLNSISDGLVVSLDKFNLVLESTKVIVPQLDALANFGMASSKLSVEQANELSSKLSSIQQQLNELSSKMKDLNEKNLNQIIKLMEMNPNDIASFLSSPIDVNETDIYGTGIFGVGLTPFYSVLAIWVGSLLACALLSVESKNFDDGEKPTLKQQHFGKMLLFLSLSLIQSTIIIFGDKYILGVNPENFKLMLLFGLLTGITFTIIIFTLVSIFGNVGKAIAVIIMVFQIAGSGGIYPIQTNPEIFGVLQPLWPFTYAINGFREAIAGPLWKNVYANINALLIFAFIFLIMVIFKKPFHKITEFMEHKFKEAGL